MATKGISLSFSEDGKEATYNEGYKIRDSPFIELLQLVEAEDPDLKRMREIINYVPQPDKPETHIGIKEYEIVKKALMILKENNS